MATVTQLQECLDLIMDPSAFSLVGKLFTFYYFLHGVGYDSVFMYFHLLVFDLNLKNGPAFKNSPVMGYFACR